MTERRAKDREKMAEILAEKVRAAGGTAKVEKCWYKKHCIQVHIACPGGAILTVDFEGGSVQPDTFVNTWNISRDSDSVFSDAWGANGAGPPWYHKVCRVSYGFESLCQQIELDVRLCVSGLAYSEERKAAYIAKYGTAADRRAHWAKMREEMNQQRADQGLPVLAFDAP